MNVQWIVPELPITNIKNGQYDVYFAATGGWSWEEGVQTGLAMSGDDGLHLLGLGHMFSDAEVTVFDQEGTAAAAALGAGAVIDQLNGRVLLRTVGSPPPVGAPPVSIWSFIGEKLPRIRSICAIGEREATETWAWARGLGWKGTVEIVPLGATVPPGVRIGNSERYGVAYLGRIIPQKRVDFVVESCAQAKQALVFGMPNARTLPAEHVALSEVIQRTGCTAAFTWLSLAGREALLQRVRCVVTASHADSQWLPGTEIRACGGIGIAERGSGIEGSNGDGLLYHNGTTADLARIIKRVHEDDAFFEAEAKRQHDAFLSSGRDYRTVGKKLLEWVRK